ncbi:hypothetical protein LTS18_007812 [Coniosporium uncinatum]|uniref:Uncharacterized protein n=1 Tax=Coniosporium uncinatum TaxID=93489 RepID=A0ACC3DZW9_9PEZI|nr:hypothetical protein LTS18_007812 [Coniosporium uncinatum]
MTLLYPPQLTEARLETLVTEINDFQLTHGSLAKLTHVGQGHTVLAQPVGVSCFPTVWPRLCYVQAVKLQQAFNRLYASIAEDPAWLQALLTDLIDSDSFIQRLWRIHEHVEQEGYAQRLSLGIFRSDYMLNKRRPSGQIQDAELKQVDFNTVSVTGGTQGNIVAAMHEHMQLIGAYGFDKAQTLRWMDSVPPCDTVNSVLSGLTQAHLSYGPITCKAAASLAILMIVQPGSVNICDEKPIEYGLWDHNPPIPTFRLEFGGSVLAQTSLASNRALLYQPPNQPNKLYEISVVYLRAGFEAEEYDEIGTSARLELERSRAIKCPSVLTHLATLRRVQQALATPGALTRFLSPEDAACITETLVPMYPMDKSRRGMKARSLATNPVTAVDYVVKSSVQGGGRNIYRGDIPAFVRTIPKNKSKEYTLMKMIEAPEVHGTLTSPQGFYKGPVISELGIFGICLWRKKQGGHGAYIVTNKNAGWSFKTKSTEVDDMSIAKGYSFFDTPYLLDEEDDRYEDSGNGVSCSSSEGDFF